MYLIDTNLIVEILLQQAQADVVQRFLQNTPPQDLYLTEFALYSLGILLMRRKMYATFVQIVDDLLVAGAIRLVRLQPDDLPLVAHIAQKFSLDFDDAYQYVAAEKHSLVIVSFDSDFDRTERGRKTPTDLLMGKASADT